MVSDRLPKTARVLVRSRKRKPRDEAAGTSDEPSINRQTNPHAIERRVTVPTMLPFADHSPTIRRLFARDKIIPIRFSDDRHRRGVRLKDELSLSRHLAHRRHRNGIKLTTTVDTRSLCSRLGVSSPSERSTSRVSRCLGFSRPKRDTTILISCGEARGYCYPRGWDAIQPSPRAFNPSEQAPKR